MLPISFSEVRVSCLQRRPRQSFDKDALRWKESPTTHMRRFQRSNTCRSREATHYSPPFYWEAGLFAFRAALGLSVVLCCCAIQAGCERMNFRTGRA